MKPHSVRPIVSLALILGFPLLAGATIELGVVPRTASPHYTQFLRWKGLAAPTPVNWPGQPALWGADTLGDDNWGSIGEYGLGGVSAFDGWGQCPDKTHIELSLAMFPRTGLASDALWTRALLNQAPEPSANANTSLTARQKFDQGGAPYLDYYRSLARTLIALGYGQCMLRVGWECDGGWFPWGYHEMALSINGQTYDHPKAYRTLYRMIHDAMMAEPGAAFRWSWNVSIGARGYVGPTGAPNDFAAWYPGDDCVDFISIDTYDEDGRYYPDNPSVLPADVRQRLTWLVYLLKFEGVQTFIVPLMDSLGVARPANANGARDYSTQQLSVINAARFPTLAALRDYVVSHAGAQTGRPGVAWYRQFALNHGKNFIISEWGLWENNPAQSPRIHWGGCDNPEWISLVHQWVTANDMPGKTMVVLYYEEHHDLTNTTNPDDVDHSLMDSHPAARAEFVRLFVQGGSSGGSGGTGDGGATGGSTTVPEAVAAPAGVRVWFRDDFSQTLSSVWNYVVGPWGQNGDILRLGDPNNYATALAGASSWHDYAVHTTMRLAPTRAGAEAGLVLLGYYGVGFVLQSNGHLKEVVLYRGADEIARVAVTGSAANLPMGSWQTVSAATSASDAGLVVSVVVSGIQVLNVIDPDPATEMGRPGLWTDPGAVLDVTRFEIAGSWLENPLGSLVFYEDFTDGSRDSGWQGTPAAWTQSATGLLANNIASSAHSSNTVGSAAWKNYEVHARIRLVREWKGTGLMLYNATGGAYTVEFERDPAGILRLYRIHRGSQSLAEMYPPDGANIDMTGFQDVSVAARTTSAGVRIQITVAGVPFPDFLDTAPTSLAGPSGLMAGEWAVGEIEELAVFAQPVDPRPLAAMNATSVQAISFTQWSDARGLGGDPLADGDQDGRPDLVEYALGSDPAAADSAPPVAIGRDADGHPALTVVKGDLARFDSTLSYHILQSTDLRDWTEDGLDLTDDGSSITATLTGTPPSRIFFRLEVRGP